MAQAKTLAPHELEAVLNVAAAGRYGARDRLLLLLTYYAGLRVGELSRLLVGDVLNGDGSQKAELRLARWQTKGRKARTVMISRRLGAEIRAFMDGGPAGLDAPLFRSQRTGGHFTTVGLANHIKDLYVLAGLDNASSHSGRRTFITNLASSGIPVRIIQELAGHKDLATTQRYIDINDNDKRVAIEQLRC